jgi:DNA-binding CsgD family transcriptional regulator
MVPGKVLGAFGDKPQILVTLFDPEEFTRLDAFAISSMFGLTPAEAKVATQIAQGLSPSDIAVQNGVKLTTVRTQLGQVLAKLGAT